MRPVHSEGVRRVLANAQTVAGRQHHRFVHTEHLLLGLLQERNSGTGILKSFGLERETLRRACEKECHRGSHDMEDILKLTPRCQHILALAGEVMAETGADEIDTRHLLVAIVQEEEGIAGQLLRDAGVTEEKVRTALSASHADETKAPVRRKRASSSPSRTEPLPFWKRLLRV